MSEKKNFKALLEIIFFFISGAGTFTSVNRFPFVCIIPRDSSVLDTLTVSECFELMGGVLFGAGGNPKRPNLGIPPRLTWVIYAFIIVGGGGGGEFWTRSSSK